MKKIIVGIDGSKESFDSYKCADALFPDRNVTLTPVFVLDNRKTQIPFIYSGAAYDIAYERLYIPVDPELEESYKKLKAEQEEYARKCLKMCNSLVVAEDKSINGVVLEGDPAEILKNYSDDYNLLVLGQRGENATYSRELIGSTTEDLIRKSRIPVLICPDEKLNLDRLLLIYENSDSSEKSLEFYINELSPYNKHITVLIRDHYEATKSLLKEKLKKLESIGIEISLENCSGSVTHKAAEMMEKGKIDAFVLGSHGRHKITEFLLGSSTIHIIRKSTLPVFIIH
jgi:nucleotide-binding universal stress UspA family protein